MSPELLNMKKNVIVNHTFTPKNFEFFTHTISMPIAIFFKLFNDFSFKYVNSFKIIKLNFLSFLQNCVILRFFKTKSLFMKKKSKEHESIKV